MNWALPQCSNHVWMSLLPEKIKRRWATLCWVKIIPFNPHNNTMILWPTHHSSVSHNWKTWHSETVRNLHPIKEQVCGRDGIPIPAYLTQKHALSSHTTSPPPSVISSRRMAHLQPWLPVRLISLCLSAPQGHWLTTSAFSPRPRELINQVTHREQAASGSRS